MLIAILFYHLFPIVKVPLIEDIFTTCQRHSFRIGNENFRSMHYLLYCEPWLFASLSLCSTRDCNLRKIILFIIEAIVAYRAQLVLYMKLHQISPASSALSQLGYIYRYFPGRVLEFILSHLPVSTMTFWIIYHYCFFRWLLFDTIITIW